MKSCLVRFDALQKVVWFQVTSLRANPSVAQAPPAHQGSSFFSSGRTSTAPIAFNLNLNLNLDLPTEHSTAQHSTAVPFTLPLPPHHLTTFAWSRCTCASLPATMERNQPAAAASLLGKSSPFSSHLSSFRQRPGLDTYNEACSDASHFSLLSESARCRSLLRLARVCPC